MSVENIEIVVPISNHQFPDNVGLKEIDEPNQEIINTGEAEIKLESQNGQSKLSISQLMTEFFNYPALNDEINKRFEAIKERDPETDITLDEVRETFLTRRITKLVPVFWQFYHGLKKSDQKISLIDQGLSPNFLQARSIYQQKRVEILNKQSQGGYDQSEFKQDDQEQTLLHNTAADILKDDRVVPNFVLGRVLVHIMTVNAGLDREDPERELRRLNITT